MTIRVALNHRTRYKYERRISLGPQLIRLRPAPHCRTPIESYSLRVGPKPFFVNWQQDPQGNYLARYVFPEKMHELNIEVDLVADMTVINPFDFFVEEAATRFPFRYDDWLSKELKPFLETLSVGPRLSDYLAKIPKQADNTVDFLVELNQQIRNDVDYLIRLEPGIQTPEETLEKGAGSCRDSAWLLVQILRNLGLASRFASGYLIQLKPDIQALDGPSGTEQDFTDLHAWTEVYLPGAGWIGMDPTSGLLTGEGHIPLACTPDPFSAAPISGSLEKCESHFEYEMTLTRILEDPRVTKPYTDDQWSRIQSLGDAIDQRLGDQDVRLTMGGEPTFVSIDDMESPEWNSAAVGPQKRTLSEKLIKRLRAAFAAGGILHYGQGKWYPGETLPRWALTCVWRKDGEPIWNDPDLIADVHRHYGHTTRDAERFARRLSENLGLDQAWIRPAFEDLPYYLLKERRLPIDVDPRDSKLKDAEERARMCRVFERGLNEPVGFVMPIQFQWWQAKAGWRSGPWPTRSEQLMLLPGDSPMGLRLPLDALPYEGGAAAPHYPADPLAPRAPLPTRDQDFISGVPEAVDQQHISEQPETRSQARPLDLELVRTALCVEPRDGRLHVFMPPLDHLEHYLELIYVIEQTASQLRLPVVIEGYLPPHDPRIEQLKVTPDPGVIEVNVHPASSWTELVDITSRLYEEARQTRLGTEKFDLDGTHTGTGGGNHVVLGGATPGDSPFLRRPDMLKSLIGYWVNHPSLSYLFSSRFIGPTSQAPRVDEGRRDSIYELRLAFDLVPPRGENCPPWLVDRLFRNLLVDLTGNTHRAEFCIDKLYSPDSSTGRLGLVEFRGFEMPPHAQMSLTQQLLIRGLVAKFWEAPYSAPVIEWGTLLHDRFLLPHFVWEDFREVLADLNTAGMNFDLEWFAPHFEFRFPKIGEVDHSGVAILLRSAIEPWYVLGEEPGGGGTVRYVDSSVERVQVKVRGLVADRYTITCNGRALPLQPTGIQGEFVAGVRYRAWQPPSCLHPTIPVHSPLVFDLYDRWTSRSLGGCTYHVAHPAGRNYETFPVNSYEAEARRGARFFKMGHTPGGMEPPIEETNPAFPCTLDLRRMPHR